MNGMNKQGKQKPVVVKAYNRNAMIVQFTRYLEIKI